MRIRWFGQSAFLLTGEQTVLIDPFGEMNRPQWRYAPVSGVEADLLLITHEHGDHNHVDAAVGEPHLFRSTAGTRETPVGDVVGIASEHDDVAGTQRGPNTIFCFTLDGDRVAHFGDFGQKELRPEQRAAIGEVDVLFVPVGGGFTIGGRQAADIVKELEPRIVVPMHYRTPAIDFLEPADEFLEAVDMPVNRLDTHETDTDDLAGVVVLAAPPGASG
jgi:L-ascorbate metabolism protein UlaG (beta-lactamase superfamily)